MRTGRTARAVRTHCRIAVRVQADPLLVEIAARALRAGHSARRYDLENRAAVPAYLREEVYWTIRVRTGRGEVRHASPIDFLTEQMAHSLHRYVLLDTQDRMTPGMRAQLWTQSGRTVGTRGARAIFRTAGPPPFAAKTACRTANAPGSLGSRKPELPCSGSLLDLWRFPRPCPLPAVLRQAAMESTGHSHAALMGRSYRYLCYVHDFTMNIFFSAGTC